MKVVHLCLASFYPDGYSYQENLLPKFHKKLGYDVEVIASTQSFDAQGKVCFLNNAGMYRNEYDIEVTRLPYRLNNALGHKLKQYIGTYAAVEKARPDILFIHGCQFLDVLKLIKYFKVHPKVKVYVDNHADFSNSATNWFSKNILHRIIWRHCAQAINPFVCKFYGVLPVRVDFLKNQYNLPEGKCELLVMGADDDLVQRAEEPEVRIAIRKKYGFTEDDFVIVTGGKIDLYKKQTLLLMEAVLRIKNEKVKLLVFGSVVPELKDEMEKLIDGKRIVYIGWIQAEQSYEYFAAADLVVFPGRHSVFWEQVAGQGIPMLVKDWPGTHHVDLGGNVRFLTQDSADEIEKEIMSLVINPDRLMEMKRIALDKGMRYFSYKDIAKRSIEQS